MKLNYNLLLGTKAAGVTQHVDVRLQGQSFLFWSIFVPLMEVNRTGQVLAVRQVAEHQGLAL